MLRGGAEDHLVTIGRGAVKSGWEVHAAFHPEGDLRSLEADLSLNGVVCHGVGIHETHDRRQETRARDLARLARTVRVLRRVRPDVVAVELPWPDYGVGPVLACAVSGVPAAVVFHLVPRGFSFGRKRLRAFLWARARRQRWIAVSECTRRTLSELTGVSPAGIDVIYNGIPVVAADVEMETGRREIARDDVRQELGLSAGIRIVTTVGRLDGQKGHIDVVPAIPHLVAEHPELRFVWVGDGGHRQSLIEALTRYGVVDKVYLLGRRRDVSRLLLASDLFLFPSRFEGLPFALLEAMAHGVPVVASDASSIPEIIGHRVDGLLFRTGDSCDLLEAVRWALRHPTEMSEMAVRAAVQVARFSEEGMIRNTLSTLEAVARA
jgi:glycosyltransferase involved in cell wall biosynthesis